MAERAPDVYSAEDLARATGAPVRQVRALIRAAAIPTIDGRLVARRDAIAACRTLRDGRLPIGPAPGSGLFGRRDDGDGRGAAAGMSLLLAGSVHAGLLAAVLVLASVAVPGAVPDTRVSPRRERTQMVFVAEPGPGGGGGGGGRREPAPPPPAERAGTRPRSSPIPRRRPPALAPPRPRPAPRPDPIDSEPLPPVLAPLAAIGADQRDTPGLLSRLVTPEPPPAAPSRGAGTGGGVGSGSGLGVGEGTGRGVGSGHGGGTGGGPYRPGSGVDLPSLLHEVRPRYTDEARRAGLQGEVLLEVVVGGDGAVEEIRVIRGLGAGLDEQAVTAVRQWRFSPARHQGTPVPIVVEVAVEFSLR